MLPLQTQTQQNEQPLAPAPTNIFANCTQDDSIKSTGDTLGGYQPIETDVYETKIELAYLETTQNGATLFHAKLKTANNFTINVRETVVSGKEKGQTNFYINKKTGEKAYLPGFELINELALLTTSQPLTAQVPENREAMIYNYEQRKEVPTVVLALPEMMGKTVLTGAEFIREYRQERDPTTGEYYAIDKIREYNAATKFFHLDTRCTVEEIYAQKTQGVFIDQWIKSMKGKVKDKTRNVTPKPVTQAPEMGQQAGQPQSGLPQILR